MLRDIIIHQNVKNKDVLDIGSLGQTNSYSLWNLLQRSSPKSLTGIDLPQAAKTAHQVFGANIKSKLKDSRIIFGNMETHLFHRQFDIIIAGDVIEHVENQGLFLTNIHRHLKPNGKLIITTPNAKWPTVFVKPNPTHTLWHDRYTISTILSYTYFQIDEFYYYLGNKPYYHPLLRPFIWHQAMLAICSPTKSP